MITERSTSLITGDGPVLEARLAVPPSPIAGVVICHPHPLYGGDMDNPVVVRVREVCADMGLATLRFNFRGVGGSTGSHGGGLDEQRDVEAALESLRSSLGPRPRLTLAGYSFGATVAARLVAGGPSEPVAALALVAPPVAATGEAPFLGLATRPVPVLIVAGSQDDHCPGPALQALASRLPRADIHIIEGANHFFFGKLFPLGQRIAAWAGQLEAGQATGCGGSR
jgi:alpha/beta superfamily hydrolase